MRVRILVVVATVLAAFLIAPAAPALALDGVQVVRVVTGNDSVDTKDHVAECPRGTVTVGGGARISGQGEPYVHITSIGPLFEHGWFAVAREYRPGTGHAWALTVWAICAEPPPGLDYVSVTGAAAVRAVTGRHRPMRGRHAGDRGRRRHLRRGRGRCRRRR